MSVEQSESPEQPASANFLQRPLSRRRLLQASGLAIAALAGGVSLAMPGMALAATLTKQSGWRLCSKCQGLCLSAGAVGACPAGGTHSPSGNFALFNTSAVPYAQSGWRWCSQCQGLWLAINGTAGRCHAWAGGHTAAGSSNYSVSQNVMVQPGQSSWRWCTKCQGMFYSGAGLGTCPAGGQHTTAGSANYCVLLATSGSAAVNTFTMTASGGNYYVKATGGGFLAGSTLTLYMEHPAYGPIALVTTTVTANGTFSINQALPPPTPTPSGGAALAQALAASSVACSTLKIAGTTYNSKTHIFRFADSAGRAAYATAFVSC